MQAPQDAPQKALPRKAYHPPELTEYGNLLEHTRADPAGGFIDNLMQGEDVFS